METYVNRPTLQELGVELPVRAHCGLILDKQNRQIVSVPAFWEELLVEAINAYPPLEVSPVYDKVLVSWASVSRTLMEAGNLLDKALDLAEGAKKTDEDRGSEVIDVAGLNTLIERINHCRQELDDLSTPLDSLHALWRSKRWEENRLKTRSEIKEG